ncbi:hypothetical protein QO206_03285 [Leeuwenhoekiella aequorea]|uniref:DUF7768 domain-containing protein n=1 Tax=Leeuwenhoekiella aequorea TaxID=283736 RepID=UPI00352CEBD2|tara:strand:+ start:10583 stop:11065 length:483 start_codon:yes stop_codon:yes gene_type:complete
MKIVYIAHPIGGNVYRSVKALTKILREVNLTEPEVVPLAPYYGDVMALNDENLAERARGLENGIQVLKSGAIRELWLYGDGITKGMLGEVRLAETLGIPVVPRTTGTRVALTALVNEGALDKPTRSEEKEIETCCYTKCNEPVYNLSHCFRHWCLANENC